MSSSVATVSMGDRLNQAFSTDAYVNIEEVIDGLKQQINDEERDKFLTDGLRLRVHTWNHGKKRTYFPELGASCPQILSIPVGRKGNYFLYRRAEVATLRDLRAWYSHREELFKAKKREFAKDREFYNAVMSRVPVKAAPNSRWIEFIKE